MCEAIKQGGGQQIEGAYLGSGATHVICQPQAAATWLTMGMPDARIVNMFSADVLSMLGDVPTKQHAAVHSLDGSEVQQKSRGSCHAVLPA